MCLSSVVIFDRDGTLIRPTLRHDAVFLLPGAREAIKTLQEAGYLIALATNQPGPAKGECSYYDVAAVNRELCYLLGEPFATIRVCLHRGSDRCSCRKPKPGMLLDIQEELGVGEYWMVGDSEADVGAALAAGMPVRRVYPELGYTVLDAAEEILISSSEIEPTR